MSVSSLPSHLEQRHVLLGLTLQSYWHCWDSPGLPVFYQVLAWAFLWFLHHLCLFHSPEKAGFFSCCFSVIAKEPEGWNPAMVCVITSERDQWCYILVTSQIHNKGVDVHKTLPASGTCNCKCLGYSHPTVLKRTWVHALYEPLTLSLRSCCFSAAGRSCHRDMCQTDISVAAPTNWNKNNHLKLPTVIKWNVSIESTGQLFLAKAKIMGRMLLWRFSI